MVRTLRVVSFVVAALAAVWALRLVLVGGITVTISGHKIRSNDPVRPLEFVFVALVVFALVGGVPALMRTWKRAKAKVQDLPVVGSIHVAPATAALLALLLFAVSLTHATTAAAGADASGYVSQADRWLHGTLRPPQPWVGVVPWPNAAWTFSPLGYKPVNDNSPYEQAPTYSPGLPLLMALAKGIGGQAALFAVVPLCGAMLVLATYGIGRRLRDAKTGAIAAWLAATTPIVIWMSVSPYSDVPVGATWVAAFFFLVGEGRSSIVLAGLMSGLAFLVRPNIAFLAPIMGLWYLVRVSPGPPRSWVSRVGDGAIYAASVLPGIVFLMVLYDHLFGSPFVSGYGRFADMLDVSHIGPNARNYAQWALENQRSLTVIGLVGLVAPFAWPRGNPRRAMGVAALMVAGITAEYLSYLVFEDWSYLRFFIPAWPFFAISVAGLAAWAIERGPFIVRLAVVVGTMAMGMVGFRTARDRFAFELWHGNRRYIAAASLIQTIASPNSAVFCMEHSGSLRYYSGRMPIRYDMLDPEWGDRAIAWLSASGVHSYAVLDEWELDPFRKHFEHQKILDALDTPVIVYRAFEDGAVVDIFDLTTPPRRGTAPRVVNETDPGRWRSWPPGPTPTLTLRPPS